MKLYLVQHGEATSKEENPQRPLTEKGKKDVTKIANFLKKANISINTIYHSSKKRSQETASILSSVLNESASLEEKQISPNDPMGNIYGEIIARKDDLMIVGHLPHLAKLSSKLLIGDEGKQIIEFQQGSVVLLEKEENWKVRWFIIPELL